MREAGDGRVLPLVQRVEPELRMVGQEARRERDELRAQRVAVGVVPVDEGEQVGRDAHAHRRDGEAAGRVRDEVARDEPREGLEELLRSRDRLLGLPAVIEELLVGHVGVRRDSPERRRVEHRLVDERGRVDRRLEGRDLGCVGLQLYERGGHTSPRGASTDQLRPIQPL
jgi:hypothetical protein